MIDLHPNSGCLVEIVFLKAVGGSITFDRTKTKLVFKFMTPVEVEPTYKEKCTDLAYKKAITGGVDIIECNVQMSKYGVAFCLDSADLLGKTNAAMTFMDRSSSIPKIQPKSDVFTFDVTGTEIKFVKCK
ncbi:glycerophosphodiester phosphodiesterase GDPDL7 [Tanacetum coccineum]